MLTYSNFKSVDINNFKSVNFTKDEEKIIYDFETI